MGGVGNSPVLFEDVFEVEDVVVEATLDRLETPLEEEEDTPLVEEEETEALAFIFF